MREWLITNGLGSYASLNYRNTNTRKFHHLLVASLSPPVNRWVFVSNCIDLVKQNGKEIPLSDVRPIFSFDFFPEFTYKIGDSIIKKRFVMHSAHNTSIIQYDVKTDEPFTMIHHPVINSRHFYELTHRPNQFRITQQQHHGEVLISPNNIDRNLRMILNDAEYEKDEYWQYMFYPIDQARHDSCQEYRLYPGFFEKQVPSSTTYYLGFSIEPRINETLQQIVQLEYQRKQQLINQWNDSDTFHRLLLSADRFIVKKGDKKTIIAGYPWFSDWGRDTLIALPGLTLVSHRFDDAKQILLSFKDFCKQGIIPNTFDDKTKEASYNSVDASLWYIDRVYQYVKYTNDEAFMQEILPTLHSILEYYIKGTMHGIHMDDDFLIAHQPGLTWMDVKLGDFYPTPRAQKAVEIQALWYNALCIVNNLSDRVEHSRPYEKIAKQLKENFNQLYRDQYDVIDTKDASCRPNKLFLVSLDHSMIPFSMQEEIVNDVEQRLLTIFGLRTLSADDANYIGTYLGDHHRDMAYHNGTVWPWLFGPFITAYVKTHHAEKPWRMQAFSQFLEPMFHVFGRLWDGSIPEIFDADPPFAPRGCSNQAWSVAEILRCWVEDIKQKRPPFEQMFQSNEKKMYPSHMNY